jgi:hypothetical protein
MIALLLALGLAAPAADADALLRQGNDAAKAEHWDEALALWAEAEALRPTWRPAFNQAGVLAFQGRPLEAWRACQRALAREIPPDRRPPVEQDCAEIEATVAKTHAEIALDVDPPDAEVRLDGEPWPPPRRTFSPRPESRLEVARAGYAPVTLTWPHPLGQRSRREVRLVPVLPAAAAPPPSGPGPAWKWVAWGVGAGAGAAGALLLDAAEARRTPRLFRADAAEAESEFTIRRDAGLGLAIGGGAALATGFVLWWLEGP